MGMGIFDMRFALRNKIVMLLAGGFFVYWGYNIATLSPDIIAKIIGLILILLGFFTVFGRFAPIVFVIAVACFFLLKFNGLLKDVAADTKNSLVMNISKGIDKLIEEFKSAVIFLLVVALIAILIFAFKSGNLSLGIEISASVGIIIIAIVIYKLIGAVGNSALYNGIKENVETESQYQKALQYYNNEDYAQAYDIYNKIINYKDSKELSYQIAPYVVDHKFTANSISDFYSPSIKTLNFQKGGDVIADKSWNISADVVKGYYNSETDVATVVIAEGHNLYTDDASSLFNGCKRLETINGLELLDTSKSKSFANMFKNCASLKSLNLSNINTSSATTMNSMFSGCSSLKMLNLTSFNTNNVENMYRMFRDCSSLEQVNISSFYTPKTIDFREMFFNCSSLKYVDMPNVSLNSNNGYYNDYEGLKDMFTGTNENLSFNMPDLSVTALKESLKIEIINNRNKKK